MAGNSLLSLVENIQTWDKLEKESQTCLPKCKEATLLKNSAMPFSFLILSFNSRKSIVKMKYHPQFENGLGYPGIQDLGIDGVGITDDGRIFAYQAKFRSDRKVTPTLRELSTFFTVSDKADWRITIANSNKLPSSIDDRVRQSRILADRFDSSGFRFL